ncbi:Metallo-dependent phosphatase [Basidiobolus meristosporus CBS 931.73]|uniref:Metallo-dependent phosphatase n=1 Tax=Basidiobolus meristosporus CBS 931.73 TaxID=1314790 RepID=A0A1Y1Y6S0_9FUNG|nr:Metallo-dependent phosphatase [Basidiobolus meristosporus CBS 931.73]|eukprot:ORX93721.1 Metallo-dependent phosphatase [Basidiobolus meristosporus CBS 931.73]
MVRLVLLASIFAAVTNTAYAGVFRREDFERVTIVHTNDLHAHLDEFNKFGTDCTPDQIKNQQCMGGVARQKTVIDRLRKQYPDLYLFDAGDQFQGTLFYNFYKGNVTAKIMNQLEYDLMTVGNHEFDDGPDHLAKFIKQLDFPVVSSNIDARKSPAFNKVVKPYHIFRKHNLGVIGYITNTTAAIAPKASNITFFDPAPYVQKYVDELRRKGVKKIVCVSHNGYLDDVDLARRTRGIDLIVGGHSHTFLSSTRNDPNYASALGPYTTNVKNLDNENTYIVQAWAWGRYVGHVDLFYDRRGKIAGIGGEPIYLDYKIPKDRKTEKSVKEWRKPFDAFADVVIGKSSAAFDQASCQSKECTAGNLVADAMLWGRRESPDVRFALINSGGIRAGIDAGDVKVRDILTIAPFGNALSDVTLSGKQVVTMLEGVASRVNSVFNKPITSFIQISGIKFTINSGAAVGSKVSDVQIQSKDRKSFEPIKADEAYRFVTLDFIVSGGDNILPIPASNPVALDTLDAVLTNYIKEKGTIDPYTDGRITIKTA